MMFDDDGPSVPPEPAPADLFATVGRACVLGVSVSIIFFTVFVAIKLLS